MTDQSTAKSPHDMTISELRAEIGRLQTILHFKVCGDPRECVQVTARSGLFIPTPPSAAYFNEPNDPSVPVGTGPWLAVRDHLVRRERPFIVCRDNPEAFNGCEEYRLEEDGPPATFGTEEEAGAVARLLNGVAHG